MTIGFTGFNLKISRGLLKHMVDNDKTFKVLKIIFQVGLLFFNDFGIALFLN